MSDDSQNKPADQPHPSVMASGLTEKARLLYAMYEKRFGKPAETPSAPPRAGRKPSGEGEQPQ
jgi:hypothetical protein